MSDENLTAVGAAVPSDEIAFDYVKNVDFRVLWVDGIIGGPTPSRHIHFSLYSERPAIPRRVVHEREPDGTLGAQIAEKTVSRNSIIRQLSADVVMTPDLAITIGEWLLQQAKAIKEDTSR